MSATEIEDTGVPLPRISEIRALPDLRLSIVWAEGSRTGRADTVDLAPLINTYKLYRPLRSNKELFQTAHLVDDGNVVAWGDGKVDMSAELIEEIANETMTPQDFASFLRRNDLTQEAAAVLLGYSPRQIGNFVSTGPIPRLVVLACYGYEARSGADKKRPEVLPDIYEQAAKEARAMLSQAAQDFADQLRGINSDMRSEVKATRAELHKSILELPQGIAESAAEMRRVIADQIEALREIEAARAELRKSILELPQETAVSADQIRRVLEDQIEALGEIEATRDELRKNLLESPQESADQMRRVVEDQIEALAEIEAARAELRKSILALPQETAENAAQMRRVIVDQIEALAELNRIVARHGRNLDTVEPTARRTEPAEPPPRRDVAREAQVPPLQSAKAAKPGGWLSNLLTRASQDSEQPVREVPGREPPPEATRTERLAIESLDSIAVDIARMIDHDAAAELWDRYRRGERNVFTRKLYNMQDQDAFEDIRRRYRSDGEFMQAVDRYIAEFERLLEEASRDDRGRMVARTYLASETGKVYTMLAQAAGRLE